MAAVRDRLIKIERELKQVQKELALLKEQGGGVIPEWADLKTVARMFGSYSTATIRYRIKAGIIPKGIVKKEKGGKKLLVNVKEYRQIFEGGNG